MQPTTSRIPLWTLLLFSCTYVSALEAQQPKVAFVTSVTGTADLGSWPEAGSAVGAPAGDAICRNLASDAGLQNAGTFVAWLSTSTDDAYCRLHGFSGKKAANCGQAQLPVDAGPWVRTDGLAFSETIDRLVPPDAVVYYPLAADEDGESVQGFVFTATYAEGTLDTNLSTCGDWTAMPAESARAGSTSRGSYGWTSNGSLQCSSAAHLICFEPGSGPALTPPAETGAVAFATSVRGTADLGSWPDAGSQTGVAAADAICQARAAAGSLAHPSRFKAWISDSTTDAKDRFLVDGPRVRPDGVKVADSLADMLDGSLEASINVSELGHYLSNVAIWTATASDGLRDNGTCSDWTSASGADTAHAGAANSVDSTWTLLWTIGCNSDHGFLYCIEEPAEPIFSDGFESGDTTAWSSVVQRQLVWR